MDREFGDLPRRQRPTLEQIFGKNERNRNLAREDIGEINETSVEPALNRYTRSVREGGLLEVMEHHRSSRILVNYMLENEVLSTLDPIYVFIKEYSQDTAIERSGRLPSAVCSDAITIGNAYHDTMDPDEIAAINKTCEQYMRLGCKLRDYIDARAHQLPDSEQAGSLWDELQEAKLDTKRAKQRAKRVQDELGLPVANNRIMMIDVRNFPVEDTVCRAGAIDTNIQTVLTLYAARIAYEATGGSRDTLMEFIVSNVDALGALTRLSVLKSDTTPAMYTEITRAEHPMDKLRQIAEERITIDDNGKLLWRGEFSPGLCSLQYPEKYDENKHRYVGELTSHCREVYGAEPPLIFAHEGERYVDHAAMHMAVGAIFAYRKQGTLDPTKSTKEIDRDIYDLK